jgi:1-acyl-sn-glycerol-3-phosphate acyltransferase
MASQDMWGPVQVLHLVGELDAVSKDVFRRWRFHRKPSLLSELVVVGSSLLAIGAVYYGVPLGLTLLLRASPRVRTLMLLALVFAVYHPLRRSSRARGLWFWDQWIEYFTPLVVLDGYSRGQRPPRRAMFAMEPHGIFPFPQALTLVGSLRKVFGDLRPVGATITTRVPGLRHLLGVTGVVPAEPAAIRQALRTGDSLMIVPGGIGEMFKGTSARSTSETFLVARRQGFVRLAVEEGAAVIPVVIFGASRIMTLAPFSRFLEPLSRILRMSVLLFWGRWGLPIPQKKRLLYAVGPPIWPPPVPPNGQATEYAVQAVHAKFVSELQRLFEKYKGVYGWESKTLKIM